LSSEAAYDKNTAELKGVAFASGGVIAFSVGLLVGAGYTRDQVVELVDRAYEVAANATDDEISKAMEIPLGTACPHGNHFACCPKCSGAESH